MSTITLSLKEKFEKNMETFDFEDDASLDDTPYNRLGSKSRKYYDDFIEQIKNNNISHVDTFPNGLGCIMVYPQPHIGISCIFSILYDCCIELKVFDPLDVFPDTNPNDSIWVYDEEDKLLRSNSIDATIQWIKTLM